MHSTLLALLSASLLTLAGVILYALSLSKRCKALTTDLEVHREVVKYAGQSMYSFRYIFDHLHEYRPEHPALTCLTTDISWALGLLIQELPKTLPDIRAAYAKDPNKFQVLLEEFTVKKPHRFVITEKALAAVNDPVLNELWAIRTPSALAEMLRHIFFLSYGYGKAVAEDWSPDGLGIPVPPQIEPEKPNMGGGSIATLRKQHGRLWEPVAR